MLERGLALLGGTAIQDRLQQGVPASMRVLREGGVKIWMVTGDKVSTAKQIATASGLVPPASDVVSFTTPANIDNALDQLSHLVSVGGKTGAGGGGGAGSGGGAGGQRMPVVIVLTGSCLALMNASQLRNFAAHAWEADAAVCCRLTPDQKAQLVNMMRVSEAQEGLALRKWAGVEGGGGGGSGAEDGGGCVWSVWRRLAERLQQRLLPEQSVICAIGDGANDVAMIQTAHVGIGIAGREGSHAVRASGMPVKEPCKRALQKSLITPQRPADICNTHTSDVSISSFSDLTRLLILHGNWSYHRSALVAQVPVKRAL